MNAAAPEGSEMLVQVDMHPAPLPSSIRIPCPACARGAQVRQIVEKTAASAVTFVFIIVFPLEAYVQRAVERDQLIALRRTGNAV
jgi:hypothetical protein